MHKRLGVSQHYPWIFLGSIGLLLSDFNSFLFNMVAMPSPLETLPIELLEEILKQLPARDVAIFWKTNKRTFNQVDNYLFGHPAALNIVKKWACEQGDVDILRAAVARDGDPNFFLETPWLDTNSIPRR